MGLVIGNERHYSINSNNIYKTKEVKQVNSNTEKINGSSNDHSILKINRAAHTAEIDGVKIDNNFISMWLSGKNYDEIMEKLRNSTSKEKYKNKDEEILQKIISSKT
ncbi:hypothetical protein [Clostridium saccharoperbutylacetonicum]